MLLSWTNCTRRAWRFTPPFTIDRWNPSEENNSEGCARTWPLKELVSKPGWLIRARLQARQFRRLNWTRKLKARIAPIWASNWNWPRRWPSTPQRLRCPSLKANCSLSRCGSIWIPKQQRRYSGGPILDLRVCLCARPTKISGLSRPIIILPLPEAFTGSTFQSLAFIGKAQRVGRRILSDQKFARGRRTRGGSSIMARWEAQFSGRARRER